MKAVARVLLAVALLIGAASCLAEEPDDSGKHAVWSSLDLQLYGYIKLDSARDSALTDPGNIGYRRPQVRVTRTVATSEASKLQLAVAITRDIGSTSSTFVGVDSGADAGVPGVQGRLGWSSSGRQAGPISIGVSGRCSPTEPTPSTLT